jgi:histidinol-phosphate aminotransferase
MRISRRHLIRRIGAGAAVAAGVPATIARAWTIAPDGTGALEKPVRLDKNESAYGPSPKAVEAARAAAERFVSRYPEDEAERLREKIAASHGVRSSRVVLGCGSSEILRMAADAFLGPGKTLVVAVPTFDLLERFAHLKGAEVIAVPLANDHSHDVERIAAKFDASTALVYVCNPNNPTGTLTGRQALESLIRKLPASAHLIVDEAYHHYAADSNAYVSFIDRPVEDERLIVTRTFSTVHGLAGLRVGYAVASVATVQRLAELKLSNGVNLIGAAAASAALDDPEHVRASILRTANDRQAFFNQASARMLRWLDSRANFVLVDFNRPAADVVAHFRKHDVAIAGPFPYFAKHARVGLGTIQQMREFWRVCDLLPPQVTMRM